MTIQVYVIQSGTDLRVLEKTAFKSKGFSLRDSYNQMPNQLAIIVSR